MYSACVCKISCIAMLNRNSKYFSACTKQSSASIGRNFIIGNFFAYIFNSSSSRNKMYAKKFPIMNFLPMEAELCLVHAEKYLLFLLSMAIQEILQTQAEYMKEIQNGRLMVNGFHLFPMLQVKMKFI